MKILARIALDGTFVEDVLLESLGKDEDGVYRIPKDCIEARPPDGFHLPRWTGDAGGWVEGASTESLLADAKVRKQSEMGELARGEALGIWDTDIPPAMEQERAILGRIQGVTLDATTRTRAQIHRGVVDHLRTKLQEIEAATSVEAVEAVAW